MHPKTLKILAARMPNRSAAFVVFALMIGAPLAAGRDTRASAPLSACAGFEVYAHRGAKHAPENSLRAIATAAQEGWPGVEIDLQSLSDGGWGLHHDPILGLKTDVAGVRSIDLSSSDWRQIRLRDRRGAITDEPGALLEDVIESSDAANLRLNMEIKEPFVSCQRTLTLLDSLERRLAGSWFLTSMDPRHLSCLKSRAPDQYVGLVVVDPNSAAQKIPGRIGEVLRAHHSRQFTITDAVIEGFARGLPAPAGIHVELSVLEADRTLPSRLARHELHLMVYSKKSGDAVANTLRTHAHYFGGVLRGVVLEDGWQAFCNTISR